jgi:hypothetical protein
VYQNITKRNLVLMVIASLIVIAATIVAIYFLAVLKAVRLLPDSGVTITLTSSQDSKVVASTNQPQTIRIHSGDYLVNYGGGEDYQAISQTVSIKSSTTLASPQLDYSTEKLTTLLSDETSSIQAVLAANIGNISDYSISGESLYVRGEWYGAILVPNAWYDPLAAADFTPPPPNPNNTLDIVRIIAQKTDGQWQIVAGPAVVFYLNDYSNIPEEVIRAVNALSLAQ